jgi:hypothetical protein
MTSPVRIFTNKKNSFKFCDNDNNEVGLEKPVLTTNDSSSKKINRCSSE